MNERQDQQQSAHVALPLQDAEREPDRVVRYRLRHPPPQQIEEFAWFCAEMTKRYA
ncbi:MAG TPA: hypothetical protein VNA04_06320 [Thermoanaerobaculia bacterium]|nr:hypothetical protein [Thermoanaerobaculia bacterium]